MAQANRQPGTVLWGNAAAVDGVHDYTTQVEVLKTFSIMGWGLSMKLLCCNIYVSFSYAT